MAHQRQTRETIAICQPSPRLNGIGAISTPLMEVNMTRRKMLLMTAGATVLGLAALVGFADHNAIFANGDDDEGQEALTNPGASKINLQQGLAASEAQGQPKH